MPLTGHAPTQSNSSMKTVLFACLHNAGRSQMAAAFFNLLADPAKARGVSAGTTPGDRVHREVVTAMREVGVELDGVKPRLLTDDLARDASVLVTMGCGEQCPFVPGLRREDWQLHAIRRVYRSKSCERFVTRSVHR